MANKKTLPQQLRELMIYHNISRNEAAKLAGKSKGSIDGYLAPEDANCHRGMDSSVLETFQKNLAKKLKKK